MISRFLERLPKLVNGDALIQNAPMDGAAGGA
jgi:hypothetical protein